MSACFFSTHISADPCVIPLDLLVKIDFIALSCSLGSSQRDLIGYNFSDADFPLFWPNFKMADVGLVWLS